MAWFTGSDQIDTGQVSPTNVAATLIAARATRRAVLFVNQGSVDVYVGPATVTTANGFVIKPNASLTLNTTALVQAITSSGTGTIHYVEEFE